MSSVMLNRYSKGGRRLKDTLIAKRMMIILAVITGDLNYG
jgi:hypothetical protein